MTITKRKTIGRKLSTQTSNTLANQSFTLSSGKKATFEFKTIPAETLAQDTYVDLLTNGRDQSALTPESLLDITRTITLQQFFPAIGRYVDGKIEILDGSRRRAAALEMQVGLNILVTDTEINTEDARQLALDIQTAKEHNLREIGLRLLLLRDSGLNQTEIANTQKLSKAKVTRAIQAASVPSMMLNVFPIQSELVYNDYKTLLDIATLFEKKQLDVDSLVNTVSDEIDNVSEKLEPDELTKLALKLYREHSAIMVDKPKAEKAKVMALWKFDDKNKYARKRNKERDFSYEFSRLPKNLQEELDLVIMETLKKHFQNT
ncbi:ParB family protein [Photobacterium leiognathi]|uniref:ParB/RepB/Spo0J family partition protein n=1 Tax=Photobacterium leiognathi TaxID=553611 RepID=A0A2T3M7F7_PHOLE|nr:ParB family protein [Photobacterium leiognathi]KJF97107.1 chromosome partitioning protein ParB [Photobacterium leiognathi]PSV88127.1 ParB/RepB/Spo0J family partition protein [Photobacterium leiognathi]